MEVKPILIESLLERTEQYAKTSYELLKLKSLSKTANVMSALLSRLLLVIILSFFALTLSTAIALWLGDILGKNYYGFLIVALFYGLTGIVFLFIHPSIKSRINDLIITQILN